MNKVIKDMKCEQIANRLQPGFYVAFRVIIGFLFFSHGASKLFGWFGGNANPISSLFGMIGLIETIAGILILIGLFTRYAASVGGATMLVALVWKHFPNGWHPFQNGGELAFMFLVSFLVLSTQGAGILSVDSWCKKNNLKK